MAMPHLAPPRLLVIDDEATIGDTLDLLFTEEGYPVHVARSLSEALELIDQHAFQFILSDLLHKGPDDLFAAVEILRQQAHPTPVGLLTGWPLAVEEVMARGFAFVVSKPFELDELVSQVAASLNRPLSAEQEQQAQVAQRYFAALGARDWDQVANLCTDDVIYALPGTSAFARTITGKAAFRAYTESTFNAFPDARFEEVHIYGQPRGVAARYVGRWQGPGGSTQQQSGRVVFQSPAT
jgi:CheY-like chemotaxis protein